MLVLFGIACSVVAFVPTTTPSPRRASWTLLSASSRARDLIQSLFEEHDCFSTEAGVRAFGDVCAYNVVYEDRFEAQPLQGKSVRRRVEMDFYIEAIHSHAFGRRPSSNIYFNE